LQDVLQDSAGKQTDVNSAALKQVGLPLARFKKLLRGLRNWIAELNPRDGGATTWRDYAGSHSYSSDEMAGKKQFVHEFVRRNELKHVWDVGCNTGDYSVAALEGGAARVTGFDFDQGALDLAFARATEDELPFLPLYLDATNPSPSQGWEQSERDGLQQRARCDGLVALALVHHIAIARNVPLNRVVRWLVGLAPRGVIEFVPKEDPMVQKLLRLRKDIFPDYTRERFLTHLGAHAAVEQMVSSSSTGRLLVEFSRDPRA
jgi:ribosomal protein L11 methylase PrmA